MRSKFILSLILILSLSLPLTGALCQKSQSGIPNIEATIKVWLYNQDKKAFDDLVAGYKSAENKSSVTFEFMEKSGSEADYEKELIDAIAAKNGPDIAMIREDWVAKHFDKLVPLSPAKDQSQDALNQEVRDTFVTAVGEKMIYDNKVFGIPLKMDTLALYYNTKHFDEANLNQAPRNWNEFVYDVKQLTKRDQYGNLTQAAAALGTSNNIPSNAEILYTLMIQNGTRMTSDDKKSATFNTSITKASGEIYYPGTNALDFYNSFANPAKETYTWNSQMPDAVRAFVDGKVSMIFDYGYRESEIYNLNPTFRFEKAPMPQIKDTTNPSVYPYFFAYAVTNNSAHSDIAWDFVKYLSRNVSAVKKDKAKEDYQSISEGAAVFSGQPYIARTFYKSREPEEVDLIFETAIKNALAGQPLQAALDAASAEITSILQNKG